MPTFTGYSGKVLLRDESYPPRIFQSGEKKSKEYDLIRMKQEKQKLLKEAMDNTLNFEDKWFTPKREIKYERNWSNYELILFPALAELDEKDWAEKQNSLRMSIQLYWCKAPIVISVTYLNDSSMLFKVRHRITIAEIVGIVQKEMSKYPKDKRDFDVSGTYELQLSSSELQFINIPHHASSATEHSLRKSSKSEEEEDDEITKTGTHSWSRRTQH